MRTRRAIAATVAVLLLGGISPARAGLIDYTFSGTASGMLGGINFSNAAFTITMTSDSSQVTPTTFMNNGGTDTGFITATATSTFSLAVTSPFPFTYTGTFIGGQQVFVDNTAGEVGLTKPSFPFIDLLSLQSAPPFDTYNLQSPIGPVTVASPDALNFDFQQTTSGTLTFFSASNVSFTATNVAPEPASVAMLGMGMIGIGAVARHRSRRPAPVG